MPTRLTSILLVYRGARPTFCSTCAVYMTHKYHTFKVTICLGLCKWHEHRLKQVRSLVKLLEYWYPSMLSYSMFSLTPASNRDPDCIWDPASIRGFTVYIYFRTLFRCSDQRTIFILFSLLLTGKDFNAELQQRYIITKSVTHNFLPLELKNVQNLIQNSLKIKKGKI